MVNGGMPRTLSRLVVNILWMDFSPNLSGFPHRCLRHKKTLLCVQLKLLVILTFSLAITEQCPPFNPLLNKNSNTHPLPLL